MESVGTKVCFKCAKEKSLIDFYAHKKMGDGRLNKCKECTKLDSSKRFHEKSDNLEWVESERSRHREKYHRLNYKEKQLVWNEDRPWTLSSKYKNLSKNMKTPEGIELHHWSYLDDNLEDVFVLPRDFHKYLHRFIILDKINLHFTTLEGIILDTREKHSDFIERLKNSPKIKHFN